MYLSYHAGIAKCMYTHMHNYYFHCRSDSIITTNKKEKIGDEMEANASQVNDSSHQVPLLSTSTVNSEGHAKECDVPNHDYSTMSTCIFLQIL